MRKRPLYLIILASLVLVSFVSKTTGTLVESRLIGYYCGSDGEVLARHAEKAYTHIIIAFVAPDQDTGQLSFVGGQGVNGRLVLSRSIAEGIRALQAKGIKVLLSFGGGTVQTESYASLSNWIPSLAQDLSSLVRACPTQDGPPIRFDGLDIDWEDSHAFMGKADYDGREFLIKLTKELRQQQHIPSSQGFILTHTPQPPYLTRHHSKMNGYIEVWEAVGHEIDWLQMQYYSNPGYQSNEQLLTHYRSVIEGWPQSGNRPAFPGIPASKYLVGKPIIQRDAGSGYVPVETLVHEIIKPLKEQYGAEFGGIFAWQILHDKHGEWSDQIAESLFD